MAKRNTEIIAEFIYQNVVNRLGCGWCVPLDAFDAFPEELKKKFLPSPREFATTLGILLPEVAVEEGLIKIDVSCHNKFNKRHELAADLKNLQAAANVQATQNQGGRNGL